jgi:hypothetical protein
MLGRRIGEAARTEAFTTVSACHFCNQLPASRQDNVRFEVESHISLLATGYTTGRSSSPLWSSTKPADLSAPA